MAAQNVNVVVITGNLTKDPEENQYGDTYVCEMRVAVKSRRKQGDEWVDKPNYFDVTVFGAQGKNCHEYLKKGRPVAVNGRLDWREWETKEGGKRQAVQIIADTVQFLGSKDGASSNGNGASSNGNGQLSTSDTPAEEPEAVAAGVGAGGGGEDDIPF